MQSTQPSMRRPSLLGPLLLIALGSVFLLGNLGLMSWSVTDAILRLWPLLLIAGGLELLIGRRSAWAAWLIALATVALLLGGIWLLPRWSGGTPITSDSITQPLGGAERANVTLALGAGTLRLSSLNDAATLVEGTVERRAGEAIWQDFRITGDTALYALRAPIRTPWLSRSQRSPTWDIGLNASVPTQLTISTGAGQSTLDLSRLQLTTLAVSTGVGQTFVTLPERGALTAKIKHRRGTGGGDDSAGSGGPDQCIVGDREQTGTG